MDVKKFSLAHGSIVETSSFEVLKKSVRFISDSDRLTFIVLTDDNEVWAVYPKATRFVFSVSEGSEVSAMCFLPSSSNEENCVAFALFDRRSGDSCLRIIDLTAMSDCYNRLSAFTGRVTALAPIEPSFKPDTWALAFGLENGAVGVFLFSENACETEMIETLDKQVECHCPVTKLYWLKTRHLLICGYDSGYLSIVRLPSKLVVFGHGIEALPISSIVSTEPENDPRLTCFVWVSAANGRRSSAAIVFRIEGENDNVICMGVHDLAANIPEADTEKAWAYLVDISSSKQLQSSSSSESVLGSSNLVSFLWEIGITGRSTDYYFALFDINAWFSWQSQANLQLKEPVFGGSKFLAVFKLPRSVNEDNRLLGAFAISSSIVSFRPRVSIVPLTSPLLYPCSLSFDVLCICADALTRVRYKSLQEVLLKSCCNNSDFSRISETQLTSFVEKLTTLGLIDMFDGSSIGCSHHESVLNAYFKFANEGEAARFAKRVLQNENYVPIFRNWLFFRATAARKDLDMSLDLVFQKCEASEHLRAVESDLRLILRLANCLPSSSASFAHDLKRVLDIFLDLIAGFLVLLKPNFRPILNDALQAIPLPSNIGREGGYEMFRRRFKMHFYDAVSSRERFVNLITSSQLTNARLDNVFLLLYTFLNAVPGDGVFTERLVKMLDEDFQQVLGVPPKLVRFVAAACFLDRKFPAHIIRQCLRLSRPLDFTIEDQVHLLRHLSRVNLDVAYEVSLQLVMIYKSEKETNWSNGMYFELFKLFLEIFSRKNYFEAPLQLCMMMPSEADRKCALFHFFKLACSSDEPHFGSFLRLISSSFSQWASSGVDPLRECIKFMCTSKQRLLVERACVFFAERGPSFLAEALAIANRANDLRFVSVISSENGPEVDRLVEKRRQIIEERLGIMPDYVRQRVIDKSRSEEMGWMFVASPTSALPLSHQAETPKIDDLDLELGYKFEWQEVEKLLVTAANSPFASSTSVPSLGSKTSTSFTGNRRSSVMNFLSNQPRLSTAKKCRFVDSPSPTPPPPVEEPSVASTTLILNDDDETQKSGEEIVKELEENKNEPATANFVPEMMPITPVVKVVHQPPLELPKIQPAERAVPQPEPKANDSCILIESDSDEESEEEEEEEEEEESGVPAPEPPKPVPQTTPVVQAQKRFIPSSLKEPSPAQKAARRIVQRSVRFSCSPKVAAETGGNKFTGAVEAAAPAAMKQPVTAVRQMDVVEISSSESEEEAEKSTPEEQKDSDEDEDWDGEDNEENEGLYMEEEEPQMEPISDESEGSDEDDKMEEDPEIYLSPMAESGERPVLEGTPSIPIAEERPEKPPSPVEVIHEQEAVPLPEPVVKVDSEKNEEENRTEEAPVRQEEVEEGVSISLATTASRLIKSVSNISPNRLAAQMALRRSMRIVTSKRRQEVQDDKKAASSSLEENKEPAGTEKRESPADSFVAVAMVEKVVIEQPPPPPPPEVEKNVIEQIAPVVEKMVETEQPLLAPATPNALLPGEIDDCRAITPPLEKLPEPVIVEDAVTEKVQSPPPVRLTRSRSANSAILPSSELDVSATSTRKRTRQTEVERLSPQSSVTSEPAARITTRGRTRQASGSSESAAILPVPSSVADEVSKSGRRRAQSVSEAIETATVNISPRKHLRKLPSTTEPAPANTTSSTTVVPIITVTEPQVEKSSMETDVKEVKEVVAALPPRPGRKRTKSNEDGMVTPSSSPKRPNVSASVSKIEPPPQEGGERRNQSAPSSPSRRSRRGSTGEQAQQLAAALSSITDSPAYHTRRNVAASSSVSTVTSQQQDDDNESLASSTVSAASSSVQTRRSTRSTAAKSANR